MKYITLESLQERLESSFCARKMSRNQRCVEPQFFFVWGDDCITSHCSQVTDTVHQAGTRYIIVRKCFLTSEEISSKRNPYIFKEKSKEINFVRKFLKNFYDYLSESLKVLNLIKIQ